MLATLPLLQHTDFPNITRASLETVQVNLGYACNQQCLHCHVNAGPRRKEKMTRETTDRVLTYLSESSVKILDLTGGAPELNANFRYLTATAHAMGIRVIDRCNLSILSEPGQADLAEFLAENQVEIVASLPCYLEENVDSQRGKGTFSTSIKGLRRLNRLGYAQENSELVLNLVYNPLTPALPPRQTTLEADYKRVLNERYAVHFNRLLTLCNMPIQRFGSLLISKGQYNDYMQLLRDAYCEKNLASVMCRNLISIDWQGRVYDCDFNQLLDLPLHFNGSPSRRHISELAGRKLNGNPIVTGEHCYACTAGQGSSCGGALS